MDGFNLDKVLEDLARDVFGPPPINADPQLTAWLFEAVGLLRNLAFSDATETSRADLRDRARSFLGRLLAEKMPVPFGPLILGGDGSVYSPDSRLFGVRYEVEGTTITGLVRSNVAGPGIAPAGPLAPAPTVNGETKPRNEEPAGEALSRPAASPPGKRKKSTGANTR